MDNITEKKICKKCNCIESDINKFEKISLSIQLHFLHIFFCVISILIIYND